MLKKKVKFYAKNQDLTTKVKILLEKLEIIRLKL